VALIRCAVLLSTLAMCSPGPAIAQWTSPPPSVAQASSSPLANLPLQRDGTGVGSSGLPMVLQLTLAGVLIAALAGIYRVRQRRSVSSGMTPGLRTLQNVRIGHGATLHVVQWDGEELLVACTPQSAVLLSRRKATQGRDEQERLGDSQ
jgi:hypothetical protein